MTGDEGPLKTALHDRHVSAGAKMAERAGWLVPLSYRSVDEECDDLRTRAAVLDLSHTGRIRIRGPGALDLLERACTADAVHQEDDTAMQTLLCNDRGGILDHGFLIRLASFWVLTTSPSNRQAVLRHLQEMAADLDAKVDDQTRKTSTLAVSGPAGRAVLDAALPLKVSSLGGGQVKMGSLMVARYIAARIDWASTWSLHVTVPNAFAAQAWRFITEKAGANCLRPAGLAAREVLRIEASRPAAGSELDETIDPITAGLEGAVDLDHDFIGRDAIAAIKQAGPGRKLVGLAFQAGAPAVAPRGAPVRRANGPQVGTVTSSIRSAAAEKVIAMAYVATDAAAAGAELVVETADGLQTAEVVDLPFFQA